MKKGDSAFSQGFAALTFWGLLTGVLLINVGCQTTVSSQTSSHQGSVPSLKNQVKNQSVETQSTSTGAMVYNRLPEQHSARSQATTALMLAPVNTQYQGLKALDMAKQNPDLSILVEAVDAAGIGTMLRFAGDRYTIFAPNNAAFAKLFRETTLTKQSLLANKGLLRALLAYHVVKSDQPMTVSQLPSGRLQALSKRTFQVTPDATLIDGKGRTAHIIQPNIATGNGMVHEIDIVMFPAN
ncbi:fasciclin domain-containing protein [Psychrobacter lutiphocae]|uniref:fasciclin domain-containing protein n=1 Tax=Psychrobacter lutiphocae TaxID=540500 RepID=UPI00037EAB59|nr:fasciclin domain-containing protein [Psychrobacter lutiphocae]